jgi:hypothetical protein
MSVPQPLPMLKPFRNAVDYQLSRIPGTAADFAELSNEAKQRAFWIAGLVRKDLVESALAEANRYIAEGRTREEFLERIGEILDEQGGTFLSPKRLDLIAQNAFAVPYTAGRYRQSFDPEVVKERPIIQYPLGPHDGSTSTICLALEGFRARYDDPVWNHIWPPNHHHERHLQPTTLTEEQALELGEIYASAGEREYPFVNGQEILPDSGWDFQPGLLHADDRALVEAAKAVGVELPAKTASDYGLADLADAAIDDLPSMPKLMPRLVDATDAAAVDSAWVAFKDLFGIAEDATTTIVNDALGDGVFVTRGSFDYLARGGADDRTYLAPTIRPTIEDPFEVWMVRRKRGDVDVFHKRYIGMFAEGDKKKALLVIVDESPDGLLWQLKNAFRDSDWSHLEQQRAGRLLMTKARKLNG